MQAAVSEVARPQQPNEPLELISTHWPKCSPLLGQTLQDAASPDDGLHLAKELNCS
jgi:hypothetical protein